RLRPNRGIECWPGGGLAAVGESESPLHERGGAESGGDLSCRLIQLVAPKSLACLNDEILACVIEFGSATEESPVYDFEVAEHSLDGPGFRVMECRQHFAVVTACLLAWLGRVLGDLSRGGQRPARSLHLTCQISNAARGVCAGFGSGSVEV